MNFIYSETTLIDHIEHPYLLSFYDLEAKKNVSIQINKDYIDQDILLIDFYGFQIDSVFAGITEKQIELIARKAPQDYKENLLRVIRNVTTLDEVSKISKALDEDLRENVTQNQQRVRNVIQYIKDNQAVFQF